MSLALEGSLDTNICLRFLLGDVPAQHEAARKLIESKHLYHISTLTIAEIVYVLEGLDFTRVQIKQNIEALCGYMHLYIKRAIVSPAITLYASHPAISFMDACLAYEATANRAEPLFTYDKKLAKQAPGVKLLV